MVSSRTLISELSAWIMPWKAARRSDEFAEQLLALVDHRTDAGLLAAQGRRHHVHGLEHAAELDRAGRQSPSTVS